MELDLVNSKRDHLTERETTKSEKRSALCVWGVTREHASTRVKKPPHFR